MLKIISSFFQRLNKIKHACSILLSIFALANIALAEETQEPAKWYQIEYIIFEHLQTDDHILRYEDILYPKNKNKQFSYITSNTHPASKYQYTQLNKDKMDLADAYDKLKRSRSVNVLDMHAWQQTLIEDALPPPIKIEVATNDKRTLFGELQLKKSRYTHAEFNLYLANKIIVPYQDIKTWLLEKHTKWKLIDLLTPISKNFPFTSSIGTNQLYQNIRYLGESRRIKEGEVHYIDHPVISAIITIKEVPSPFQLNNDLTYVGQ